MTGVILARIDDRFIHGQVTVGWGQVLRPDHIVLANDAIAADPWQGRVYATGVPPPTGVSVLGLARSAAELSQPGGSLAAARRVFLLTGSPADMFELAVAGVVLPRVNVGGMHFAPGKIQILPSVFVDRQDVAALRAFVRAGAAVSVQALPGAREVPIDERLLDAAEERL
jgi:mannose/fructose/N-acetylgalactosamine-specific phosphotransferase system component IIB